MSDHAQIEAFLPTVELFKGLPPASYAELGRQAHRVTYDAGAMIFGRGDTSCDLFIVSSGRVRLSVLSLEGRELSFSLAGPGSVFGEIAAFDGGIRSADATAITAVEAVMLPSAVVHKLVSTQLAFARNAIAMLGAKLRATDQQLESVALHDIEVRLARFLLGVIRQQCPPDAPAINQVIKLEMSQSELALLIGASRPKVNAALALLEADGAIIRRGEIIECRMPRLKVSAAVV